MKIQQEIIEATYTIEDLTKDEFNLIKDGLREIISENYKRYPELSGKGEEASRLLDLMD